MEAVDRAVARELAAAAVLDAAQVRASLIRQREAEERATLLEAQLRSALVSASADAGLAEVARERASAEVAHAASVAARAAAAEERLRAAQADAVEIVRATEADHSAHLSYMNARYTSHDAAAREGMAYVACERAATEEAHAVSVSARAAAAEVALKEAAAEMSGIVRQTEVDHRTQLEYMNARHASRVEGERGAWAEAEAAHAAHHARVAAAERASYDFPRSAKAQAALDTAEQAIAMAQAREAAALAEIARYQQGRR